MHPGEKKKARNIRLSKINSLPFKRTMVILHKMRTKASIEQEFSLAERAALTSWSSYPRARVYMYLSTFPSIYPPRIMRAQKKNVPVCIGIYSHTHTHIHIYTELRRRKKIFSNNKLLSRARLPTRWQRSSCVSRVEYFARQIFRNFFDHLLFSTRPSRPFFLAPLYADPSSPWCATADAVWST